MSDVKVNTRSPYYIEANRVAPDPVVIPPPVEETNNPPTVTITASNTEPCLTETVTLTAVATDSDGTVVSYLWGGTASPYTTESITVTNSAIESKTFYVIVTDDDGDTANASITIHWKDCTTQLPNQDIGVSCGDTFNQAQFIGTQGYNFFDIGDKIGDVTINFQDTIYSPNEVPIKFDLTWNGTTVSTGFIGSDNFDTELQNLGASVSDINTSSPTNKTTGTSLTITKSAASPSEVTLVATALIPNDSYTFQLVCPDVLATTTYYYTLTGTCNTGTTEFTYLDVNGDTQTVVLAKDSTQLVSAQENSVSVAICTGTTEKGGESFDLGKPEQQVDKNVEFVIWQDESGSLGNVISGSGEVAALANMAENELKNSFLTYYENDTVLYNQRVRLYATADERIFNWAAQPAQDATAEKIVHLIYTDETSPSYYSTSSAYTQPSLYLNDMLNLRSVLDGQTNFGDHLAIIFCIEKTTSPSTRNFTTFIDAVSSGTNGFDGSKGLSDRSEIIFVRNVLRLQDSAYYHQVTIQALQDLGFKI